MDYAQQQELTLVSIPKIVMQTWKTNVIPEKWKSSRESIEELMPDWSYVLMTDEDNRNFVVEYFPDFLELYDNLEYPIQRADIIRYMWLYINGGVYIDMDYRLETSLEPLFYSGSGLYLMLSPNFTSYYTNSIMASTPRHPFWLELLEEIRTSSPPIWAISQHLKIMSSSGPAILNRMIKHSTHTFTTIPYRLVAPCNICQKVCDQPRYLTPLEGGSWCGQDSKIYNWIVCNPWQTVSVLIVAIAMVFTLVLVLQTYTKNRNNSSKSQYQGAK